MKRAKKQRRVVLKIQTEKIVKDVIAKVAICWFESTLNKLQDKFTEYERKLHNTNANLRKELAE